MINGVIVAFLLLFAFFLAVALACATREESEKKKQNKESSAMRFRNLQYQVERMSQTVENDDSRAFRFDTAPEFCGERDVEAVHELHVFMYVNPTPAQIEYYKSRVDYWNKNVLPALQKRDSETNDHGDCKVVHTAMKAPVLTLWFRDGAGTKPVTVCQSARHVQCNNRVKVVQLCEEDKQFFENRGEFGALHVESIAVDSITVVRQKIEACAYNIFGVPQTEDEAARYPMRYFEVHIRTQKKGAAEGAVPQPITDEEHEQLKAIANRLSLQFGIPIPLSINVAKGYQRFLNARFYGIGMEKIEPMLTLIRDAIEESGDFVAQAYMSTMEYVWFDSLKAMDSGWIDYSPQEFQQLQQRLQKEDGEQAKKQMQRENEKKEENASLLSAAAVTALVAVVAYYFLFY